MHTLPRTNRNNLRRAATLTVSAITAMNLTACAHMMMMTGHGARRPAATEFGLGPRPSANNLYTATIETARELKPRQMYSVMVKVTDQDGNPVAGAKLAIDGGMPQHGHGLPTRPRMTRALAAGTYEIEGVRFNMGGWWEFKVTIAAERGEDTVTFNLSL